MEHWPSSIRLMSDLSCRSLSPNPTRFGSCSMMMFVSEKMGRSKVRRGDKHRISSEGLVRGSEAVIGRSLVYRPRGTETIR